MKKKSLIIFSIIFIVGITLCIGFKLNMSKTQNIETILSNKYYSYLPLEAKEYIRQHYNETGELILTEKNKKENVPYLNPQYVEYLTNSNEQNEEYGYIPPETIVDYIYGTNPSNEQFPESFDLRNVEGKNYVTPIQRQFGGLCWAYSSTAQIEGLLLKNSGQSYSDSSTIFSERQLDYATSKDGIIGDKSLYPYRLLHDEGGAYSWPWSVEVDGLGLASIAWEQEIGDSVNRLEPNKVYRFDNSLYEVDNTVVMPNLNLATLDPNSEEDMQTREEYLNTVKGIIKNYGGAVAGSIDPTGQCSIPSGNSRLIYNNRECIIGGAHAMQIIGWDDNYEYSFCKKSNSISADLSSCAESNIIRGKGVWILKNSWGENNNPYPYLAYDNYDLTISAVKSVDTKKWDNYYHASATTGAVYGTIEKEIENEEQINKIKLNVNTSNVKNKKLDVYIAMTGNNYQLVGSIDTDLPGFYTLDVTDKNIMYSGNTIKIKAMYDNSSIWWSSGDDIRIYTSNVNDDTYIKTEDYVYDEEYASHDYYEVRLEQSTKGIPENSSVTYKILDNYNNEITAEYSFEENIVYANRIYPKIIIDSTLNTGEYKIQTLYNNVVKSESKLTINGSPVVINGDGTSQNPYIITNSKQLNLVRKNRFAYYELGSDIDLSYDTQNENGLFYNDGLGWNPIEYGLSSSDKFSGSFDGKGHIIRGLYINRPEEDYVGLFKNIYSYGTNEGKQINIVNLTLENPNITGNNYVGGIAGNIDSQTNIYLTNLQNLYIIGGNITGNNYVGGIAGNFRGGIHYESHSNRINSLFNSSSISANNYAGGLFGNVENTHVSSGMKVYIKNVINIGDVSSNGNASGLIGNIKMRHNDPINIENALNVGIINGNNCSSGITCELDSESSGTLNLKNIYYIDDYGYDTTNNSISSYNVKQKLGNALTDSSNYNEWDSFNNYWRIDNPNDIARIPVLKNMNMDYISSTIDKVVLSVSQNVNIADSISSENQIKYTVMDSSIASIDNGIVVGKKIGTTNLIISSKYEQLIVPIYVISQDEYTISFDANGGEGTMQSMVTQLTPDKTIPNSTFTKEGYTVKEWNTEADGSGTSYKSGQSILDFLNSENNIVLYAQWQPIKYTVIFHSNEGLDRTDEQILTYDKREQLTVYPFTYGSYVFLSWNTKADGSGTSYNYEQEVLNLTNQNDGVIDLYAIWKKYKISYNANGGEGTMDDTFVFCGDSKSLTLNSFTKEGYHFGHWNTQPDDTGTSYYNGKNVTLDSDLELYAIWYPNNYGILWYNEDGTKYKSSYSVEYDKEYTFGDYKWTLPTGYTFKEWNTKLDGTGDGYVVGDKFKNLVSTNGGTFKFYAILSPIKYKIRFNSNNSNNETLEQVLTYDDSSNLLDNNFEYTGYTFTGWNTEADGSGTSYTDKQEVMNLSSTENEILDLYAQWDKNCIVISYNANGGEGTISNQQVVYNTPINLSKNTFTKEGYTFKEWNTKADGSGTSYTDEQEVSLSSNLELYAQWQPNKYTITFYANGGQGSPRNQSIDYDNSTNLSKNTFTKKGYTFTGWNTELDGSGTSYTDEQEVSLSSNLELYAQWQPIKYTIIFNSNSGTYEMKQQKLTYDEQSSLLKNTFIRENYTFTGWNTKVDGSGISYTDEQEVLNLSSTENEILDLYAQWASTYDYIINNYEVDETNKYISKIMVNTEVDMFTPNITLGYGYGIDVDTKKINNKRVLYTGGKTRITKGLNLYREYTNIVIGDINGDGAINSADLLKIRQHLLGSNTLSGAYFLSSDINYDNNINSADLLRVRQHLLGTKPIE